MARAAASPPLDPPGVFFDGHGHAVEGAEGCAFRNRLIGFVGQVQSRFIQDEGDGIYGAVHSSNAIQVGLYNFADGRFFFADEGDKFGHAHPP